MKVCFLSQEYIRREKLAMKRFFKKGWSFALVAMLALSLTACGGGVKPEGDTTQEPATEGQTETAATLTNDGNYVFASGGTSGTYYPLAGAIATLVNAQTGVNATVQSTGASKENVMLISQDEAEFAIIQNDVLDYAYNGTGLFETNGKIEGLATVASIYPEMVQVVVAADSGINSISDLKGKKVSIGDAGSGVEQNALQVLEAYGLTVDDIAVNRLSFKESGSAFKDGQIDAFFVTAGVPNTAITELAVTRQLKLVDIAGAEGDALKEKYPFYTSVVIPNDVYKTENDINTLAVRALIVCREDMNEEEVYNFTKAIYDNLEPLGESYAKAKEFKLEEGNLGVTVPMHAGAQKYFDEKGVK